jgi:Arc/MetJ-type ribon-helix-helix transcriptional regulator
MNAKIQTATLQTEVPKRLLSELQGLVDTGWSRSLDEIVLEALRRYADSHRQELNEEFIRQDVEWGLRGSD